MNDHDALLAAVHEAPDDDLPRLAFADWCDEHGQADRAAFIRAQIQAECLGEGDPHRLALEDGADELLAAHLTEWLGPLGEQTSRWVFRRGFVESAAVELDRFHAHAEALFAAWPLRHLRFQGPDADYVYDDGVRELARSPWLARLERLTICHDADTLSADGVAALAECPHLANLRELDLGASDTGEGMGAEGVRLIARSPHFANLTALRLRWQSIGDDGARALARSPHLRNLRLLDLGAIQGLTDAGVCALLRSPVAAALRSLNLEHDSLTARAVRAMIKWGEQARPAVLYVNVAGVSESDMLARSPLLEGVVELGIENVGVLASPHLRRLGALTCGAHGCLARLAGRPGIDRLHTLDLSHGSLGADDLRPLADAAHLHTIRRLEFWHTYIGDRGVQWLAQSGVLARLTYLKARFCDVSSVGVQALASSSHAANLRTLLLSGGNLSTPGLRALAKSPHLTNLRELDLCGVEATDSGVAAVAKAFPRLRWLDLSSNDDLSDAAARSLARASWPLLERLTLFHLNFSNEATDRLRQRWGPRLELRTQDKWR